MVGLRKGPHRCNGATLGCQAVDALTIHCEPMPSLDTDRALSSRTWQDKGHEEPLGYRANWQTGGPPLSAVWRRTRYRILQRLPVRRFPSFTPDATKRSSAQCDNFEISLTFDSCKRREGEVWR